MESFLVASLPFLAVATFVAFAVAIYRERQLAAFLEKVHPRIWAGIAPVPGAQASVSSPFARFVLRRGYLEVRDEQATLLGERARHAYYRAFTLFFVLLPVGLAISLLKDPA